MKTHSPRHIIMVLCLATLAACGGEDKAAPVNANDEATVAMTDTAGVPAVLQKNIDLAPCLA